MNKKKKGNYYQLKTRKWYEKLGYTVYPMEFSRSIFTPKGVIYIKKDIAGSDLLAMNGEEMIFIQSKTNKSDISKGIKEFKNHPFPKDTKKIVVRWEPRAKQPTVYEV